MRRQRLASHFSARGGHLGLLRIFGGAVYVPRIVAAEVRRRGADDPTSWALATASWLQEVADGPIPQTVQQWAIGPGESMVIGEAMRQPGSRAVIDDLAGRKCAASLGVPVAGTLGIVLLARRRGLITAARPVMEDLVAGGMFLSRAVLDRALAGVGE